RCATCTLYGCQSRARADGDGAVAQPARASAAHSDAMRCSMQSTIDLLGQIVRDAVDAGQIVDARCAHATHATEALQQLGALLRADARNVFELAPAGAHTGTPRAHAGDGKAVRFVTDLGHQHQRCRVVAEVDLFAAVGEHQFLEADLAPLPLLDADDDRDVEPNLLEHLARHGHLAAAAIDEHQAGPPRATPRRDAGIALAGHRLRQLRVAPRQP